MGEYLNKRTLLCRVCEIAKGNLSRTVGGGSLRFELFAPQNVEMSVSLHGGFSVN